MKNETKENQSLADLKNGHTRADRNNNDEDIRMNCSILIATWDEYLYIQTHIPSRDISAIDEERRMIHITANENTQQENNDFARMATFRLNPNDVPMQSVQINRSPMTQMNQLTWEKHEWITEWLFYSYVRLLPEWFIELLLSFFLSFFLLYVFFFLRVCVHLSMSLTNQNRCFGG